MKPSIVRAMRVTASGKLIDRWHERRRPWYHDRGKVVAVLLGVLLAAWIVVEVFPWIAAHGEGGP